MNGLKVAPRGDCSDVSVGDAVLRLLAGHIVMSLPVKAVGPDLFECAVPGAPECDGWLFERRTGVEYDPRPEVRSGSMFGRCISYIVLVAEVS